MGKARIWLATVFAAAMLSPLALAADDVGVVSHVKVVSDKVPDVSSLDAWKASFIKDGMTDEQKALAAWKTVCLFQYQDTPPAEFLQNENTVNDAIKIFNVYGYSFCGVATSHVQALTRYLGLQARGVTISHHVVPEVFFDGSWHLLDGSLMTCFRKPDGKIASVEEIMTAAGEWYGQHPDLKGNEAKLREYMSKGPGWKTGPAIFLTSDALSDQGWLPTLNHGWYSLMGAYDGSVSFLYEPHYSVGYQVNIQLRKGERLTRNWSHKNLHANMDDKWTPGCMHDQTVKYNLAYTKKQGDLAPGRVGNGTLEYDLPLADGSFRGGALVADNLATRSEDGAGAAVHVKDAVKDGVLVVRMPSSYVYLKGSAGFRAAMGEGGAIAVAFSDNNGLDWKELTNVVAPGNQTIDLSRLVLRRYDYRLRFTMKGKGTGLESLKIVNDIQCSQRALPALDKGDNKIAFAAGPQEGTITIEGCTNLANKGKQLVYTDFHPTMNSIAGDNIRALDPAGDITFPIAVPGEITRLRFGTSYRARDAKGGWDYQVSFDGGKTYKTVDRASGPFAGNAKWVTVGDVPPGTKGALVRFTGQTASNATMIFNFRIDADYKEPRGGFAPVKVTYLWTEGGDDRQDVHVAKQPSETYTIRCASKPLLKSIIMERAE